MTKAPDSRKANGDRPAFETEVTDAMVAAGVEVLLAFCPDTAAGDETDRRMVVRIFRAMGGNRPDQLVL